MAKTDGGKATLDFRMRQLIQIRTHTYELAGRLGEAATAFGVCKEAKPPGYDDRKMSKTIFDIHEAVAAALNHVDRLKLSLPADLHPSQLEALGKQT